MRILSISRNESRREREREGCFSMKNTKQRSGSVLDKHTEKGTPPILAHWNIVSVYNGGYIYIYIYTRRCVNLLPSGWFDQCRKQILILACHICAAQTFPQALPSLAGDRMRADYFITGRRSPFYSRWRRMLKWILKCARLKGRGYQQSIGNFSTVGARVHGRRLSRDGRERAKVWK